MAIKTLAFALFLILSSVKTENTIVDNNVEIIDNNNREDDMDPEIGDGSLISQIEAIYRKHFQKVHNNEIKVDEVKPNTNGNTGDKSHSNWVSKHRAKIINSLLILTGFAIFVLVGFRYYAITQSIKVQSAEIEGYAQQLEKIIEGTDKLVFMTWKDQKEGLKFIDNPAYKKKSTGEMSKVQQIQAEIEKVEEDITKKSKEIDVLRDKELYYINQIEKLEKELEEGRELVLDEGAALGFAETVIREFK